MLLLSITNITATCNGLVGTNIYMDIVSVGATINVMLAAVLAKGTTIIDNPAKEPHIVDVANFLNTMGADVRGAGTDVIKINGVEKLSGNSTYSVVPDQIEAGTFMLAAAATKGDVIVRNVIPKHLEAISAKLTEIGCQITEEDDAVRVFGNSELKHTQIKTLPYPGFPTDMQAQFMALATQCNGTSVIEERLFENRFMHVSELQRLGADISLKGNHARINGKTLLHGADVMSSDLRASTALIVAAIVSEGTTNIQRICHLDRGYEQIENKMRQLGADIMRLKN